MKQQLLVEWVHMRLSELKFPVQLEVIFTLTWLYIYHLHSTYAKFCWNRLVITKVSINVYSEWRDTRNNKNT